MSTDKFLVMVFVIIYINQIVGLIPKKKKGNNDQVGVGWLNGLGRWWLFNIYLNWVTDFGFSAYC